MKIKEYAFKTILCPADIDAAFRYAAAVEDIHENPSIISRWFDIDWKNNNWSECDRDFLAWEIMKSKDVL